MKKLAFLLVVLVFLVACGGGMVAIGDIPAYPDATALEPGVDPVADTLVDNMAQDAQIRDSVNVGGQIEQKAYRLPAGASWDDVQNFYNDKLGDDGWESGLGGIAGSIAGDVMSSVNQSNDMMQTTFWSRGKQTLTMVRVAQDVAGDGDFLLIMSLATN
ncbi:MAG: hypothetical protein H6657_15430 [Ardenticatenaceae bacterium]|nr:hypothetical protein [Ardenticatenaceae bacterium]